MSAGPVERVMGRMSGLRFGNFELDIPRRRLSASGNALHLGGKAFDILAVLVSRSGEIIGKQDLIDAVWPDTTVEDGALRVHISSLRKLLADVGGDRYIENVPGRGYVFVVPVDAGERREQDSWQQARIPELAATIAKSNIPRLATRLIGREEFVEATAQALTHNRIVTISGTGGIGKTSVALAVGDFLGQSRRVLFLDLASLNQSDQVMPSLGSLLGITTYSTNVDEGVLAVLGDQDLLLIFDNCEHLIDAVASAVERIVTSTPSISVLATSREPLRVARENIRQLPSLTIPPEGAPSTEVLLYSAPQLFHERVAQSSELEDLDQPDSLLMIASIVRQLDGIPLAIELAASRAATLGLPHLAASLDNPLAVLRKGRRTAPPRQQTLRATLDWSYDSLTEQEKRLLQDIAVFAGPFTASAAQALRSSRSNPDEFHEDFDGLFLKSFLSVVGGDGTYRLLETTRRYALEKLTETGRLTAQRITHALYCEQRVASGTEDWKVLSTRDWLQHYSTLVNDVRSAVRWSMSAPEHWDYAVGLIAKSHVLWVQLGLMSEQAELIDWAIESLPRTIHAEGEVEMQLRIARGGVLYHTKAFVADDTAADEFVRAGEIAQTLGDIPRYIQALTGATSIWTSNGHYSRTIAKGLQVRADLSDLPAATFSRMLDNAYFFRGDLFEATKEAEGSLENAKGYVRTTQNTGVGYEQKIIASTVLGFTEFLQGRTSEAFARIDKLVAEAKALDYAISTLLLLMTGAGPMSYLAGDKDRAIEYVNTVTGVVKAHNLHRWEHWVRIYSKILIDKASEEDITAELAGARGARLEYSATMAGPLASLEVLERALSGEVGWCRPELLRLKGERLLTTSPGVSLAAFLEAIALARAMGATFWELRCAISAFKLDPETYRPALSSALAKVDASLATYDVDEAKALLKADRFCTAP
jgi:predicted ATPase/DNA-binding winged helix-turn-helix (wHTH) protein